MFARYLRHSLSDLGTETDRAMRARALAAGVKAVIGTRQVCKIIVLLIFAATVFAISLFRLVDVFVWSMTGGPALGPSFIFYGVIALISLGLVFLSFSERLWIKALGLDQIIAQTTDDR